MRDLKESFVDFKTAQLLFKVGYNHPCITSYNPHGVLMDPFGHESLEDTFELSKGFVSNSYFKQENYKGDPKLFKQYYAAPLITQVETFLEKNGMAIERKMTLDFKHMFMIRESGSTYLENYVRITKNKQRGYSDAIYKVLLHLSNKP